MSKKQSLNSLSSLKSERTTFQLTIEAYEKLDYLTEHFGITQKEMLSVAMANDEILDDIIKVLKKRSKGISGDRKPKTKVMSKGALDKLNELSKNEGVSRDKILELAIRYYYEIIQKGKERHAKAKDIIEDAFGEILKTKKVLSQLLNGDDPILARWSFVEHTIDYLIDSIMKEIEKGTPIDPDDLY